MAPSALVLPSPLVGPAAYAVLAQAFSALGWSASVADLPDMVNEGKDVVDAFASCVALGAPDLVVAHSNAGLVAPTVAGGIPVVFMDAALPPSAGECAMAPVPMMDHLESLADDAGVLPPWTQWWDAADVAPLFPDAAVRRIVAETEPRLPLGYFRSRVSAPVGWEGGPRAYLAFGTAYAAELARARELGWPCEVIEGAHHLHHLHEPADVARRIVSLARAAVGGDEGGRSV